MKKKPLIYKTPEEIEIARRASLLVCKVLTHVATRLQPGLSGDVLDREAEELIRDHGALPGFKGLYDCPSTLLVSKNEEVVHGLPGKEQIFKDGDIVSVDCGTIVDEFYGDAAYTFCIGNVSEEVMRLCEVTKLSLYKGIDQARTGNRIGDISHAIQYFTEREHGYGVVRELVGHGLGRSLHEGPDVPNYGRRGKGPTLQDGLIIAIEPMVNLGRRQILTRSDGWTIVTKDHKPAAHYEHSIAIRPNGEQADILSDHRPVEEAIRKNSELREVAHMDEELILRYQPVSVAS